MNIEEIIKNKNVCGLYQYLWECKNVMFNCTTDTPRYKHAERLKIRAEQLMKRRGEG